MSPEDADEEEGGEKEKEDAGDSEPEVITSADDSQRVTSDAYPEEYPSCNFRFEYEVTVCVIRCSAE